MKIKTVLITVIAGGVGYVLGSRAGRARFEELKARADEFAHSPQVKEAVQHVAEVVKENAQKLPDPVANAVNAVADAALKTEPKLDAPTEPTFDSKPGL